MGVGNGDGYSAGRCEGHLPDHNCDNGDAVSGVLGSGIALKSWAGRAVAKSQQRYTAGHSAVDFLVAVRRATPAGTPGGFGARVNHIFPLSLLIFVS